MLELQMTAVLEVQHGLSEGCIHDIPRGLRFREISLQFIHILIQRRSGNEVAVRQSVYLEQFRGGSYVYSLVHHSSGLMALWMDGNACCGLRHSYFAVPGDCFPDHPSCPSGGRSTADGITLTRLMFGEK